MARARHTMTRVRWMLLAAGTLALALAWWISGDMTVQFTAAMAYGIGVGVLLVSERIISSTRNRPETILANTRQLGG